MDWKTETEINPFFYKLRLVMVFITQVETKLISKSICSIYITNLVALRDTFIKLEKQLPGIMWANHTPSD